MPVTDHALFVPGSPCFPPYWQEATGADPDMIGPEDVEKVKKYGGTAKEVITDFQFGKDAERSTQVNVELFAEAVTRVLASTPGLRSHAESVPPRACLLLLPTRLYACAQHAYGQLCVSMHVYLHIHRRQPMTRTIESSG